eukprot:1036812-Prymnesium_polylepis.1
MLVTLPCAYRDRRVKVSLLQRCRSGGRRRLTVPTVCIRTLICQSGRVGGYMGWVFTAVGGLQGPVLCSV